MLSIKYFYVFTVKQVYFIHTIVGINSNQTFSLDACTYVVQCSFHFTHRLFCGHFYIKFADHTKKNVIKTAVYACVFVKFGCSFFSANEMKQLFVPISFPVHTNVDSINVKKKTNETQFHQPSYVYRFSCIQNLLFYFI